MLSWKQNSFDFLAGNWLQYSKNSFNMSVEEFGISGKNDYQPGLQI
jgi:hypothetical protein